MTPAKGYTEMKDSGIPSIGDIPSAWNITRIHNLFFEVSEKYSETNDDFLPLLSVSEYYGVAERAEKIDSDSILIRAETLDGYKKCKEGDIVSNIMLTWKGALGRSPKCGIVSPAYCVYRPRPGVNSRFYHYLFRTISYQDIFRINSTGLIDSRLRLYSPKFFVIQTIVPPKEEQEKIVSYLDTQCAKIDEIIAQAKASIEDYKQWKASIIYEAVTKGLDPNVELKESGVPWIGKVPKSWACCKQKYVMQLINGRAYKDDEFETEGKYRVLRVGNLFSNPKWYYSNLELEEDKYCNNGDLLYAWSMSYGPVIWNGERVIYHYHIWKTKLSKELTTRFTYYYLIALSNNIKAESHATTMGFVTMKTMNNSYVAFPSLVEQSAITTYLDTQCAKIDDLVSEKQSFIDDLESYKKSLIYEVVTGKRRV